MSERVRLRRVEVELWVRVVRVLVPMPFLPSAPFVPRRHEGTVREEHWTCRLDDLEAHEAIVRHAEPHRACTEPVFDAVAHVLEEVPFLSLTSVFRSVVPSVVSSACRIEREHIDARGSGHRDKEIVRHNKLVVLDQPTLERDSLGVQIVALIGHLGPREEQLARTTLLEAIVRCAAVQVW